MSLYIDMKMILSVKCSGLHCGSLIRLNLLREAQRHDSCDYFPFELRRHAVDLIHILEVIVFRIQLILLFQVAIGSSPIFPAQSTESEKTYVLALVIRQDFSHSKLVDFHVASLKPIVLTPVFFLFTDQFCSFMEKQSQRLFFAYHKFTS